MFTVTVTQKSLNNNTLLSSAICNFLGGAISLLSEGMRRLIFYDTFFVFVFLYYFYIFFMRLLSIS